VVSVTFDVLNLEHHTSCSYDSVSLYDGSSANSSALGRFCTGNMSTITSSGSSLFVVFQTDKGISRGRFSLNWKFIDQCEAQGWFITIIFLSQHLSASGHSKLYMVLVIVRQQIIIMDDTNDKLDLRNQFHHRSLSLDTYFTVPSSSSSSYRRKYMVQVQIASRSRYKVTVTRVISVRKF